MSMHVYSLRAMKDLLLKLFVMATREDVALNNVLSRARCFQVRVTAGIHAVLALIEFAGPSKRPRKPRTSRRKLLKARVRRIRVRRVRRKVHRLPSQPNPARGRLCKSRRRAASRSSRGRRALISRILSEVAVGQTMLKQLRLA